MRVLDQLFSLAHTSKLVFYITITRFLQHIYSLESHGDVFACQSNITANSSISETFLAYDIIIFDYGLMHRILGTNECVANYLDGGFMRMIWCIDHTVALLALLIALYILKRPTWLLWPALLMQSSYALGMSVLTMATAPKMLEAISGPVDVELACAVTIYVAGFSLNWFFTFVLWHHYWRMDNASKSRYVSSKR
ncbi:hypothetical protein AB6A40_010384 [Gnathostoma spinigerum]|uniref:Uncharacterized protein n=1 Tax=Gnathostoma spinigerum TaxID=75299 RepID=A0ABD6EUN0_9BILA